MLSQDFKDFIELLNANNVRYIVVGGYAVALHGYPRYTKDLDIWIECAQENAENIMTALKAFGFGSVGLKDEDFLEKDQVIQLGYPPNRIDLLTGLKEINFEACYQSKIIVNIHGVPVNFIDIENLIKTKRATGRSQDLADVENLES